MQTLSWWRNTRQAPYSPSGAPGFMGVYPTGSHVLCGFGEGAGPFHLLLEGCPAEWVLRPSAKGPLVPVSMRRSGFSQV